MSPACLCRILGALWLCSFFTHLFLGSITFGWTPPIVNVVGVVAFVLWIVSSVLLVAFFVRSVWRSRSNAPDAFSQMITRWFSAVASGLLGGVTAHQVNHLFPGYMTFHSDWLFGMFFFGLIGMLVGAIPLAFHLKSRTTAIIAFIFSAAFSWFVIAGSFR